MFVIANSWALVQCSIKYRKKCPFRAIFSECNCYTLPSFFSLDLFAFWLTAQRMRGKDGVKG